MLKKFHNDLIFGLQREIELLPMLKTYFKDEKNRISKKIYFDYIGNKKFIELKSRDNNYSMYPTAMIGYNKIKKHQRQLKMYILFFVLLVIYIIINMIKIKN